ncbi:MAG: hypothetical protein QOG49_1400, partial [Frankiaceae bacterium]|nr:hypothetical protein [Frankiaceae bacterium]
TSAAETTDRKAAARKQEAPGPAKPPPAAGRRAGGGVRVVAATAGVLALLLIPVAAILGLKRRRRHRRRLRGSPSTRIAGGWAEVIDLARDARVLAGATGTRREIAASMTDAGLMPLARRADEAVFAPGEPSEREVTDYWADVATARGTLIGGLGRWARIRSALSSRSLRGRP